MEQYWEGWGSGDCIQKLQHLLNISAVLPRIQTEVVEASFALSAFE
jgi:hypothetical protein